MLVLDPCFFVSCLAYGGTAVQDAHRELQTDSGGTGTVL